MTEIQFSHNFIYDLRVSMFRAQSLRPHRTRVTTIDPRPPTLAWVLIRVYHWVLLCGSSHVSVVVMRQRSRSRSRSRSDVVLGLLIVSNGKWIHIEMIIIAIGGLVSHVSCP